MPQLSVRTLLAYSLLPVLFSACHGQQPLLLAGILARCAQSPMQENRGDGPSLFTMWQGTQLTLHPGAQAGHPLRGSRDRRTCLIGNTVWGPHATGTVLRSNCWRSTTDLCISVALRRGERGVSCLVLPLGQLPAPFPVRRLPVVHEHKKGDKRALCQCLLSPWRTNS